MLSQTLMRTLRQRGHGLLLFIRKSRDGAVRVRSLQANRWDDTVAVTPAMRVLAALLL